MNEVLDINEYSRDDLIEFLDLQEPVTNQSFQEGLRRIIKKYPKLKEDTYNDFLRDAYRKLLNDDNENTETESETDTDTESVAEIREGKKLVDHCMDQMLSTCTKIYKPSETLRKRNGEDDELKESENILLSRIPRLSPEDDPLRNVEYDNLEPTFANDVPLSGNIVNRLESNRVIETGSHNVLIPNRIQVQERFDVPILRGQYNPNTKNIFKRLINVDSIYRQILRQPPNNFTIDLAINVEKVLSLRLVNFQIRKTWYAVSQEFGTNFFFMRELESDYKTPVNNQELKRINIPDGNYTEEELVEKVNDEVNGQFPDVEVIYNKNTGKTTFRTDQNKYYEILFYNHREPESSKINNNLGWILGFRNLGGELNVNLNPNDMRYIIGLIEIDTISEGIVDVYGPKYILLGIDDFNNNHVNHSIINISEFDKKIRLPDYFSSNLDPSNPLFLLETDENGNQIRSSLTEAQAFTIQQILLDDNERRALDNRTRLIANSDILAKIPVTKPTTSNNNSRFPYILADTGSLKSNVREYFGPIDISRIRVILYNDKGQIIDLNNQDFSFTLEIEQLYKY